MAEGARRLLLGVAYEGTLFAGFQRQDGNRALRTVQGTLEEAILALTGGETRVVGAGRTDAGVHARGQVVHADVRGGPPVERWPQALSRHLPEDLAVWGAREVPPAFHAQRSATGKTYRYTWLHAPLRWPLGRQTVALVTGPLDAGAMAAAVERLCPGKHDFRAFQSTGSRIRSTTREVRSARFEQQGNRLIFEITANGFLYHMVRRLAGTLVEVGRGRLSVEGYGDLLQGRVGPPTPTAPASGLSLEQVFYDGVLDLIPPD